MHNPSDCPSCIHTTSGSSDDPNNYRGITLLNCIGKIFTSILYKRISDWEEVRNLLPEEQFGFRKYRRTTDCIFIFNTLIETKKFLGNQARKGAYSAKKSILYLQFPPPVISLKLYDL